jgi:hypothetical protein
MVVSCVIGAVSENTLHGSCILYNWRNFREYMVVVSYIIGASFWIKIKSGTIFFRTEDGVAGCGSD